MSSGAAAASSSISYHHHHQQQQQRLQQQQQQQGGQHHHSMHFGAVATTASTTCYPSATASTSSSSQDQKDFSRPLHVDCSVEYELPNAAKPPQGVRNEPLLMIHPCYFRKIESQRRSPFVNNLPSARIAAVAPTIKRSRRGQQVPQQGPQQAAQYPHHHQQQQHLWDPPMPPLVPITSSSCCKPYSSSSGDSGHWTDPDRSPDRPEGKQHHQQQQQQQHHHLQHQNILSGKYRQYLRAHRLHPYVGAAIPLAFPQVQQVCYNV